MQKIHFFAQKTRVGEGQLEVGGGWKGDATEQSYEFPIPHVQVPFFTSFAWDDNNNNN